MLGRPPIRTGEPEAYLRSADFFDVENHRKIGFSGRFTERTAETVLKVTIRGAEANPQAMSSGIRARA